MNTIRVILVDDERLAREEIRECLQTQPDMEIVGEAANADEAEELIRQHHPDLVFLDIQMPERSGFDLLASLDTLPLVIFTTAFDQYAVKAFEVNALDYLLKPIREERFASAIDKIRVRINDQQQGNPTASKTLVIREGQQFHFINTGHIHLVESMGNYARIYYNEKKVLLKKSLNQIERMLDQTVFFRISRTQLIHTGYIDRVDVVEKSRLMITLKTGMRLPVSTRQSALLKNRYNV